MDNPSRANVYLDNEPLNVKTYQRGTTNDLVARFGSAEKGQTNLDLLKAETQKSFRGGMFQKLMSDPEMVNSITGAYFNELDGNIYFSPQFTDYNLGLSNNPSNITAWCVYGTKFLFIAYHTDYVTPGNKIARIDITTGAVVAVTVPAGVTNSIGYITSMVTHKDCIFFCGSLWGNVTAGTYMNIHRITTPAVTPTVTDIGGVCYQLYTFREKLYLISHTNVFFGATNEFGAVTYDALKQSVGQNGVPATSGHVEYNGALYFGKQDGLYRFDGVSVVPVIDYRKNPNATNFKNLCMLNGKLYYTMGNKVYRFDGVNIEMIQNFEGAYTIVNMTSGVDRLWLTTRNNSGVPYSDKFGNGITYEFSIFAFNGVGFFEYQTSQPPTGQEQASPLAIQIGDYLCYFYPDLWINGSLEVRTNFEWFRRIDLRDEFSNTNIGSNRSFTVYSSEIDNGYPAVPKTINGVMVEYEGLEAAKSHLKLEAQYFVDGVWNGTWLELWNEKNVGALGVTNDYRLHEESEFSTPNLTQPPAVYNKVKYKLTCSIDNGVTLTNVPRVRSVSIRYTLQPNIKKRWLLGLALYGKDNRDINDVYIGDAKETRHANQLRKVIYDALVNKKPILFYDADYSEMKQVSGSYKVKGTHQISSGEVVAIEDNTNASEKWINRRVSSVTYDIGNDDTTIVLDSVGFRRNIGGSTVLPATITNGAEVRKSHAVYITRVSNERYLLDENTLNNPNGYTDIPSDIVVELQEV